MELSAIADDLGGGDVMRRRITRRFDLIELGDRGIPKKEWAPSVLSPPGRVVWRSRA